MTFPNFQNKYDKKAVVQAKDFWKYKKNLIIDLRQKLN